MWRRILHVVGFLAIVACVLELAYAFWEFFFEHDGMAFYAYHPARVAIIVTVAIVSGIAWHLVVRRLDARKNKSGQGELLR
jgi:membrane-bound ClpP family serine protease